MSTSNNNITLTTDNISQGTVNKYAVYPIPISNISSFTITSPLTGQYLYYNGSQWINQNITESNITNLTSDLLNCEKQINKNAANGYCPLDQISLVPLINIPSLSFSKLSNFLIVSPSNNQTIYYINYAGLWENTQINKSFLSDFNIASPTANQILQNINGKWIYSTLGFTSTLSGDTYVNISNLSSGQVLQYNGSKWANSTLSMGSSTFASACIFIEFNKWTAFKI